MELEAKIKARKMEMEEVMSKLFRVEGGSARWGKTGGATVLVGEEEWVDKCESAGGGARWQAGERANGGKREAS